MRLHLQCTCKSICDDHVCKYGPLDLPRMHSFRMFHMVTV